MGLTFGTQPELVVLQQELNSLSQGAEKAMFPCAWQTTHNVVVEYIAIFMLTTPSVVHSFSFFKQGTQFSGGAVSVTTSGNYWSTRLTGTDRALKGFTDYVSVRHDTNAQDGDESASHVNEGGRIWAILGLVQY